MGEEAAIRINREEVTWAELGVRLRDIYKTRATKIMFIHGDEQIEFSQVARAIDLAREADPTIAIGLVTKEMAGD
ncbi:MAG: hypothetical protein ABIP81_04755 [Terriglobales bacterium]